MKSLDKREERILEELRKIMAALKEKEEDKESRKSREELVSKLDKISELRNELNEKIKKRSHSAETFQGDLKHNGKFNKFYRRGIGKVKTESILHDIVWNLRRIFNSKGTKIEWVVP